MREGLASSAEIAAYLDVKPGTLDAWAYRNEGPPYVKVGRNRRYDWNAVRAWVAQNTVTPGKVAA